MRIAVPGRWALETDGTVEAPVCDPDVVRIRQRDGSLVIYRVKSALAIRMNRAVARMLAGAPVKRSTTFQPSTESASMSNRWPMPKT